MQEKTEIKWDEYGNPIIYPEQEDKMEQEEKSVIITLLEKFTKIKKQFYKDFYESYTFYLLYEIVLDPSYVWVDESLYKNKKLVLKKV